jgi:hypothetical protein
MPANSIIGEANKCVVDVDVDVSQKAKMQKTSSANCIVTNCVTTSPRARRGDHRAPRHFLFPPSETHAKEAAARFMERFWILHARIVRFAQPAVTSSLLSIEVQSNGIVPFFSSSYYALHVDPKFFIDSPFLALTSEMRDQLRGHRVRMLTTLDSLWELYTAHWLCAYTTIHVGDRSAALVLAYMKVIPSGRSTTDEMEFAPDGRSRPASGPSAVNETESSPDGRSLAASVHSCGPVHGTTLELMIDQRIQNSAAGETTMAIPTEATLFYSHNVDASSFGSLSAASVVSICSN